MDDLKWPIILFVLSMTAVRIARRYGLGARWSVFRRRVSKVADGREGLVRLQGRVAAADEPLVQAPISQARCLFYDCVVEDNSDDSTRQVRREYRGSCFRLDDGTGTALVRFPDSGQSPAVPVEFDGPPMVRCAIPVDRKAEGPALRAALERLYVIRSGDALPKHMSAREGSIVPGDHVSVVGFASTELDPSGIGYRNPPLRYVVTHGPDTPLVITASSRRA